MHQAFISGTGGQEDARQPQNGSPCDPDRTDLFTPSPIGRRKQNILCIISHDKKNSKRPWNDLYRNHTKTMKLFMGL